MTVMSEGLVLNSNYIKMGWGCEKRGGGGGGGSVSSFPYIATSCDCLPCGLTVIHLQLCDCK